MAKQLARFAVMNVDGSNWHNLTINGVTKRLPENGNFWHLARTCLLPLVVFAC